jgi:DNA-binding GntR family transcriptional regulator
VKPEEIATILRQAIRENTLAPGSPLVQQDLAEKFGVSRNPIREALRMLVTDGLVDMRHGDGAAVRKLSLTDLNELYDLRLQIEPHISQNLIQNVSRLDLERLNELAAKMDEELEVGEWMKFNYDFHALMFAVAGGPRRESLLLNLLNAVQPYSYENIGHLGGKVQASNDHHEMVDAIENKSAEKLSGLIRAHLQTAKENLESKYSNAQLEDRHLNILESLG